MKNIDKHVVEGFGSEWERFDQTNLSDAEKNDIFQRYFSIFPWDKLPEGAVGMDIGCGSGRWAALVAPKVKQLYVIDASEKALNVARKNLAHLRNVKFFHASVSNIPVKDDSLDFAYSLGVLHHVPDTKGAILSIAKKLKSGAPLLLYLYYAFDNKPVYYRWLWRSTELFRWFISRSPLRVRHMLSDLMAAMVYWPLARVGLVLNRIQIRPRNWPLSYYSDKSFYLMRTCALDRFGTKLEQRFSRDEIRNMLEEAGFSDIEFSENEPYWCVSAIKDNK